MTDHLVAFLRARLDEDKQAAQAATAGPWRYNPDKYWNGPGHSFGEEFIGAGPDDKPICVAGTGPADEPQSMADAAFVARHHPARVLAEVDAKRRILDWHAPMDAEENKDLFTGCTTCSWRDNMDDLHVQWPCATLRLLALPHRDHPDYRQEWTP